MVLDNTNIKDYLKDDALKKNIFFYFFSNAYLEYLEEHGRKESTIELYANILKQIIKVLGKETTFDEVDERTVSFLIRKLTVSEATARVYLHVFGNMMEFATGSNPVRRAKILWNASEIDRIFIDRDQFSVLLHHATTDTDKVAL